MSTCRLLTFEILVGQYLHLYSTLCVSTKMSAVMLCWFCHILSSQTYIYVQSEKVFLLISDKETGSSLPPPSRFIS
jgi:hypothetical protein